MGRKDKRKEIQDGRREGGMRQRGGGGVGVEEWQDRRVRESRRKQEGDEWEWEKGETRQWSPGETRD